MIREFRPRLCVEGKQVEMKLAVHLSTRAAAVRASALDVDSRRQRRRAPSRKLPVLVSIWLYPVWLVRNWSLKFLLKLKKGTP